MQNLNEKHREEPMAERQKLLGLMTEIVSAHASNNARTGSTTNSNPTGFQHAGNRRTCGHCTTQATVSRSSAEVRLEKSHSLSGLRQPLLDAQAPLDDRPQAHCGAISAKVGVANIISDGRARLREGTICPSEEYWVRSEECRAEEGCENGSQEGCEGIAQQRAVDMHRSLQRQRSLDCFTWSIRSPCCHDWCDGAAMRKIASKHVALKLADAVP
jgi:hypothetical protein